jgi:hypothetical protein
MLDACAGEVLTTAISASGDDDARDKARALVDGHAVVLWDGFRFIERFKPPHLFRDPKYSMQSEVHD